MEVTGQRGANRRVSPARPFAIGLCIMFFPTVVLGTINAVMSPVVTGAHGILESQMTNVEQLQQERDALEYEARVREARNGWLMTRCTKKNSQNSASGKSGTMVSMWWGTHLV